MTKKEEKLLDNMISYYENNEEKVNFTYTRKMIDNMIHNNSNNPKVMKLKDLIETRYEKRKRECDLFATILNQKEYSKEERYLLAHHYIPYKDGDYEFERDCLFSIKSIKGNYTHLDIIYTLCKIVKNEVDTKQLMDFFKEQKMDSQDGFNRYKNPYRIHNWKENDEEVKQDFKNLQSKTDDEKKSIIGDMAEIVVYQFERQRLHKMGRDDLAERILHVSRYLGDIHGYDILSFDGTKDKDGNDNVFLIEVKGYYSGNLDNIYLSNNEYQLFSSDDLKEDHTEYLVYQIDYHKKRLQPITPHEGNGIDVSGSIYKLESNKTKKKVLTKI